MLKDKRVLVAGASSGIGRAIAVGFANAGARVMASARREERLLELQQETGVAIHVADAADRGQMEGLYQAAVEAIGGVDVLVYATGTNTPNRSMKMMPPELWDEIMTVNLTGAYHLTRCVLPAMRTAGRGDLIYV